MQKTLKSDNFFYTPVVIKIETSIAQFFDPRTTFVLKLEDGTWVHYQLKFNEFFKAKTLADLLEMTYKIDELQFFCYAMELPQAEKDILEEVFSLNDNFNLDPDKMYKLL